MSSQKTLRQRLQYPSNLKSAWKELNKSNPRSHGLSSETIHQFGNNLESRLSVIRKKIKNNTFSFSAVRGEAVPKIGSPGKRPIRIADVEDRVVQRAIARLIEETLVKKYDLYNPASFAYLKRRSIHEGRRSIKEALKRMIALYSEGRPIVLEADIQKFFDTVNQEKLLNEMIFPVLQDNSINNLIESALKQEVGNLNLLSEKDKQLFLDSGSGLPQGGSLSPLFANVYLSGFDRQMLQNGFGLVRYADDFIVMCKDAEEAKRAHQLAKKLLEDDLGLKLHPLSGAKTKISKITQDKFEFLGVMFNGKRLWPSTETQQSLKQKLREITEYDKEKSSLLDVLLSLKYLMEGWISTYCFTDIEVFLHEVDEEIRERVGHAAFMMGWFDRKRSLSNQQRKFSGIPLLLSFLSKQKQNLN